MFFFFFFLTNIILVANTLTRMLESQRELYDYLNKKPDAVIPLEIGGGNGLQGLIIGASSALDIPAIDGDWMGRAYPVSWQTTPVVFEKKAMMVPTCISDGNGRIIVSYPGVHPGCASAPLMVTV